MLGMQSHGKKSQIQLETTNKSAGVEISGLHTRCQTIGQDLCCFLARIGMRGYEAVGDKDAIIDVYSRLV